MRGLGNVASLPDEHIRKHSTAVLSAVMTGMDDRNDPNDDITLEAMRTLNKIFEKVEEDTIRNILINISLRIRPCFEKDKPAVRAAAIELFGNLSQFGDGPSKVPFLEQVCVSVSVSVSVCLCVSVCVCVHHSHPLSLTHAHAHTHTHTHTHAHTCTCTHTRARTHTLLRKPKK